MVKVVGNILNASFLKNLTALKNSARLIDSVQLKLATGKKVNSALDNPHNYFTSLSLSNTAADYSRLLDGISQSKRTLEETFHGLDATERLLGQAEAIAQKTKDFLTIGESDPALYKVETDNSGPTLSSQILSQAPDVYYRLNETAGPIIDYGSGAAGPVGASYSSGASANAPALYPNGASPSVQFDGVNDRISVSDSSMINLSSISRRTVELVFNADNTTPRQILYEEGAQVNGLTIYIDNGSLYVTAEDDSGANRFTNININAPIVAGQTYHVAFVLDAPANSFSGYLDGALMGSVTLAGDALFPSHSGDVGIGGMNGGAQFHDGESSAANGFNFAGRISDVAIHNTALTQGELESHASSINTSTSYSYYNSDYEKVLEEIDKVTIDANYRGVSLLRNDTLKTNFNPEKSNFLELKGEDLSANGLGLKRFDFNDLDDVDAIISSIRDARENVRAYSTSLSTSISLLDVRLEFTQGKIKTHRAGADDLVLSDPNRDGAELLATQIRQTLGVVALGLAANSERTILRLF